MKINCFNDICKPDRYPGYLHVYKKYMDYNNRASQNNTYLNHT